LGLTLLQRFLGNTPAAQPKTELQNKIVEILGYTPISFQPYELAFVHSSASLKSEGQRLHNERLEFLGDSVLDLIVSDYIYQQYPEKDEGELTRMRSALVNRQQLNHVAGRLGLDQWIQGKFSKDMLPEDVKGNTLEAFIGAIYVESGFHKTVAFVSAHLLQPQKHQPGQPKLDTTDYKSELFMWAQRHKKRISFETTRETGRGENRRYVMNLLIEQDVMGTGEGTSKKKAQQMASKAAFKKLNLKK
jgi:ribonuclease-3